MVSGSNENDNNAKDPLASLFKSMGGGDDCDRPACDDTKSALTAALGRIGRAGGNKSASTGSASGNNGEMLPSSYNACPPTREEIGTGTWSLLHSMAAWFPNQPTAQDKQSMSNFMSALARFYPCTWCATDFQKNIELSPPRTETREDLCMWLCDQHNIVNDKLEKPLFHCKMDKLDERWRKSSNPDCEK